MKTEEYKFGYVRDHKVIVFNNPIYSFRIFGSHFLENVKVVIGENGTLRITGTEICCDLYTHKTVEGDWNNEPEEEKIQVRKVGWPWKRREEKYLEGWVRTKKRVPIDLEFGSGWILERRREELKS
jgi:hypothetical protein